MSTHTTPYIDPVTDSLWQAATFEARYWIARDAAVASMLQYAATRSEHYWRASRIWQDRQLAYRAD